MPKFALAGVVEHMDIEDMPMGDYFREYQCLDKEFQVALTFRDFF